MRRDAFDESRDMGPGGPTERQQPCTECKKPTLIATLTQYGARCHACFEFYLTCTPPSDTANKRADGSRGWAQHLKAREFAGARLTPTQRAMWRAALKRQINTEEQEPA